MAKLLPVAWQGCVLSLFFASNLSAGGPPSINSIHLSGTAPQLGIVANLGTTNQIQTLTNLAGTNWVTLATLVVTQSSYSFADTLTPPGSQRFYRVVDPNPQGQTAPTGMVLIPAGSFEMGDTFGEGESYELPLHTVYVSAFYLDKFEVTKALWDQVKNWSAGKGYDYDYAGAGKGTNHPVQSIDWYDMAKWCNARSEIEGRRPVYYSDAGLTQVYRSGHVEPFVDWNAPSYRLPTEAEWEKAARGGAAGHRFPWSDVETISHAQANYYSDPSYAYDVSPTRGFNPAFVYGVTPYTSPVGSFAPNGYGLYDMAGNVWEWCWDYGGLYSSGTQTDPHGPDTGSTRMGRGGNWDYYAAHCRCSYRYGNLPTHSASNIGFRCALPAL